MILCVLYRVNYFVVTLLSASGDDGVAGYMARGDPIWCGYYPQFPATSPYVVAVGGSMVRNSPIV